IATMLCDFWVACADQNETSFVVTAFTPDMAARNDLRGNSPNSWLIAPCASRLNGRIAAGICGYAQIAPDITNSEKNTIFAIQQKLFFFKCIILFKKNNNLLKMHYKYAKWAGIAVELEQCHHIFRFLLMCTPYRHW
ncbi:MAG: hypothetical protein ACPGOZ_03605, partial [Candidatus Puniceispirillum sp.]